VFYDSIKNCFERVFAYPVYEPLIKSKKIRMAIAYWILGLYPSLKVLHVEEPTTLREFIKSLGGDYMYAYKGR